MYEDWLIEAPTTRRLEALSIEPPDTHEGTDAEGLRIVLAAGSDGDNWLAVVAETMDGFTRVGAAVGTGELPWPRTRFGGWARYHATVEWVRAVVALLGWTLTEAETRLLAELERYGEQDPARRRVAA